MTEIPTDFWTKWHHAHPLERLTMIQELTKHMDFIKLAQAADIPDDVKFRIMGTLMNSYFEDLYYTMIPIIKKMDMHPAQLGTSVKKK